MARSGRGVRIIVDTNIFVSGLLSRTGPPGQIVNAVIDGRITALFSEQTFAELEDVLGRARLARFFSRAGVDAQQFLVELHRIAEFLSAGETNLFIRDPKDAPLLALLGTEPPPDALVTGDNDFTEPSYAGVPVLTPALLVEILDQ